MRTEIKTGQETEQGILKRLGNAIGGSGDRPLDPDPFDAKRDERPTAVPAKPVVPKPRSPKE